MDVDREKLIAGWQSEYDAGVGKKGVVKDVIAEVGRMGGIAIWLKVIEKGKTVYYSPYFDQEGSQEDTEAIEENADAWAWMMLGATDWAQHDWGKPETRIPAY
jgi:hypothetical protein